MADQSHQLVQKLWNYCNILRDDGLSYGDYVEQLTFLLFLKMADEQARSPFLTEEKRRDAASTIPKGLRLGQTREARWRRSRNSLPPHPRGARPAHRHARD